MRYLPFVIWFGVAFALIAIGTGFFLRDRAFVARSFPVDGKIVSVHHGYVNSEQRWTANIVWKDRDGGAHDYALFASSGGTYGAGERVELRYDPAEPTDVRTDTLPIGAFITGGIGVAFLGFGLAVVVAGLRRERMRAHGATIV